MYKQTFQCRIHDIRFEGRTDTKEGEPPVECPMCLRKKMDDLEDKLSDVTYQRDQILDAINVKTLFKVDESRKLSGN